MGLTPFLLLCDFIIAAVRRAVNIKQKNLINKAIDDNTKNEITKNNKGKYIENETNSIRIDIKFTDDDSIHTMEEIYLGGIDIFVQYYNQIKFKCTKIEYHQTTHKVKYMFFEQVSG